MSLRNNTREMPNWVYSEITPEETTMLTHEIMDRADGCLGQYYHPMPEELEPPRHDTIDEMFDKQPSKEQKELMEQEMRMKYGYKDWYEWKCEEWGTKWGACEPQVKDDASLSYRTAWAPFDDKIIEKFANDCPNFTYFWEEEQGYGEEVIYKNGIPISCIEWDIPHWKMVEGDEDIWELCMPHTTSYGEWNAGFYLDGCFDEYLGSTLEEARETMNLR